MRSTIKNIVSFALLVTLTTVPLGFGLTASAQQGSWGTDQMQSDRLLSRIETRWNQFRRSVDSDLNRSRTSNDFSSQLTGFEEALRRLRERPRERNQGANGVRDLLAQAGGIDGYVRSRQV